MDREALIGKLNEDLAGELGAIIQYITYAAKATGPFRPQLTDFFLAEVPDEQGHARYLANKIVALGGEPTTEPRPVPAAGTNREMLEAVLEAERRAVRDYTQRATQADRVDVRASRILLRAARTARGGLRFGMNQALAFAIIGEREARDIGAIAECVHYGIARSEMALHVAGWPS